MNTIDTFATKLFQFFVLFFFTAAIFVWYGCAVLLPLALWFQLTQALMTVFGTTFSVILALAAIIAMITYLSKIPKLFDLFLQTGFDVFNLGVANVRRVGETFATKGSS